MFNLSEVIDLPGIQDIIDPSNGFPIDILRLFTYAWVTTLGGWFFAGVIGVLGAALYIKYDNAIVSVIFFILMTLLLGPVLLAVDPNIDIPSASAFVYMIGIFCCFAVGFLLYNLFHDKGE